jgi:ABC-type antimicrobial peptide transport system ATPase subunit
MTYQPPRLHADYNTAAERARVALQDAEIAEINARQSIGAIREKHLAVAAAARAYAATQTKGA